MADASAAAAAPPPIAATAVAPLPSGGHGKKKGGKGNKGKNSAGDASSAAALHPSAATTSATAVPAQQSSPSPSASIAPPDPNLLDLISNKISYLEGKGKTGSEGDESALTTTELESINSKMDELKKKMEAERNEKITAAAATSIDDGASDPASSPSYTPLESVLLTQLQTLTDLYRTEMSSRTVSQRMLKDTRASLVRTQNQKRNLENLCRELQQRNKKLCDDLKTLSVDQARAHSDMKSKFESSLSDIQTQLNKHAEERMAQQKENDKLRDNLAQLLKFDSLREDHFTQQLKTKELELKLMEAKFAQQSDFAAAETKKCAKQNEKLEQMAALEQSLRQQLNGYATKFEQVQTTLTKSNDLFATFKAEMEKTSSQLKKLEKEKVSLEKKNSNSQLTIIQLFEERQKANQDIEKLKRQNQVLTNLCKELKNKTTTAATAAGGGNTSSGTTNSHEEAKEESEQIESSSPAHDVDDANASTEQQHPSTPSDSTPSPDAAATTPSSS